MTTGRERIQDTLSYLELNGLRGLADAVRTEAFGQLQTIGDQISLDSWHLLPSAGSTNKRRALRALLLCQRVFLIGAGDWNAAKHHSLDHWKVRQEQDILRAIDLYRITTDDPDDLAKASERVTVEAGGQLSEYGLTLTRDSRTAPGAGICFDAVKVWLLMSGLVSMRWFTRHRAANTQAALTEAFGRGHVRWSADAFEFKPNLRGVPPIRRGFIVHLYGASVWQGHWMISLGHDLAAGVNSDITYEMERKDPVPPWSINNQFRKFKEAIPHQNRFNAGVVEEIDPSKIPGRI